MRTTATTPDVPLTDGASTYGWSDDGGRRTVYGEAHVIEAAPLAVTAFASQRRDGSIIDEDGDRALIYVDEVQDDGAHRERMDLPPAAARQLADALVAAADEIEQWTAK